MPTPAERRTRRRRILKILLAVAAVVAVILFLGIVVKKAAFGQMGSTGERVKKQSRQAYYLQPVDETGEPAPPEPQPPAPSASSPADEQLEPVVPTHPSKPSSVSVRIKAPSVGTVGDKIYFILEETGLVKSRVWSVFPAGTIGFDTRDNDRKADFATRFTGTYVFIVSVSSPDGDVSHHYHVLEMRKDMPEVSLPSDEIQPEPSGAMAGSMAPVPAKAESPKAVQETAEQRIARWTAEVKGATVSEKRAVAGILRQVSRSITTGLISGERAIEQCQVLAMREPKLNTSKASVEAWQPWWGHLRTELWPQLRQVFGGKMPDGNAAATLSNIATMIEPQVEFR